MTASWLSESNAGLMSRDPPWPVLRPEQLSTESVFSCLSSDNAVSSGIFLVYDSLAPFSEGSCKNPPGTDVCPVHLWVLLSLSLFWHYRRTRFGLICALNCDLKLYLSVLLTHSILIQENKMVEKNLRT